MKPYARPLPLEQQIVDLKTWPGSSIPAAGVKLDQARILFQRVLLHLSDENLRKEIQQWLK